MEVSPDQIINGLLDEIKRLTIENVALKAALNHKKASTEDPVGDEVK
jgi:hypothetical protein